MIARHTRSVLCIGNDPVALNLRSSLLKEHGWVVFSCGSGHAGVLQFQRVSVDVVVLDLNGDGSEIALIAGALKRIRPVLIVVLVGDPAKLNPESTNQAAAVIAKGREKEQLAVLLEELVPER